MQPAPGYVFPTVVQTIHGHVGHIVLGVRWEGIREDDPLAVASNQISVPALWCRCDLKVARVGGARALKV